MILGLNKIDLAEGRLAFMISKRLMVFEVYYSYFTF